MKLSEEERKIVDLVKEGKTSKEIGLKLSMSTATINRRTLDLCIKFDAINKINLASKIVEKGY